MAYKFAYFIDFMIWPLIILAYFQSYQLTALLKLPDIYFLFILFMLIHIYASIVAILSNYVDHGQLKASFWLMGFGPTLMALLTFFILTLLPFLKWPFYLLKWIPLFDLWITPFIMGLVAFITQMILRFILGEPIYMAEKEMKTSQSNEQLNQSKLIQSSEQFNQSKT